MLQVDCRKQLGAFAIECALSARQGATLVLVGENGAGKTTILNLIAGLVEPDEGSIRVDGTAYFDSRAGIALPPHGRSIGYVFQDYALFPHLTVFDNVAFGLRARGARRADVRARTEAMLGRMGVADLAARRPRHLSGGQQQRVALARALVAEPRVLLLDEPLAALDKRTRTAVHAELRRLLAALPCITVMVTHSPLDALVFGDAIAVVDRGRIEQSGSRDELLRCPRSRHVADLMGVNLFHGAVASRDADGLAEVRAGAGVLRVMCEDGDVDLFVAVDPREVTLHTQPPAGTAQNVFEGAIIQLLPEPPFGDRVRVVLDTHPPLVAEITAHAMRALSLREGQRVYASFKALAARTYR